MLSLNMVNLIQFGTASIAVLGLLMLWRQPSFRGVAVLIGLIALASLINLFEDTGLTRNIYLISPIFVMLFGPASYLATKHLVLGQLSRHDYWHLLPAVPFLLFTEYVQWVIAAGSVWRLIYAGMTAMLLVQFKRIMDAERSDSDDYSLNWLFWLVLVTAGFNFVDLVRLNSQHMISHQLNVLGQGINNGIWLVATGFIVYKLANQGPIPQPVANSKVDEQPSPKKLEADQYQSIFAELDQLFVGNQWFLTPRLTLAEVAELTGIQSRDISRAINTVAQKSFNEYVNNYRVEFVCHQLQQNVSQSLTDIALAAGFSSKASFNQVFKQSMGVTPSAYKAQQQV
ncbi:AraC family transcriptional regulator [Neiella sp. HB171785]|uniref:AraC family transcriptional regulator n=1 Tax=Neiella litorisoli TaxID=2771431 RepID=A0A8J6QVN1_9GAMM|nr:helix-turn-helix domain-containing protein [Neiella litorisoli]MBD1390718.1 AraC family transcriptional regulator [Neiella litorisoli]